MPNFDRGMIKWQPFNSVVSSKTVIKNIMNKRNKTAMPILSEDQKKHIEETLIKSFYENTSLKIEYFYNGKIEVIEDKIKKIDSTYHKIYFNKHTLLFDQITNIYLTIK